LSEGLGVAPVALARLLALSAEAWPTTVSPNDQYVDTAWLRDVDDAVREHLEGKELPASSSWGADSWVLCYQPRNPFELGHEASRQSR